MKIIIWAVATTTALSISLTTAAHPGHHHVEDSEPRVQPKELSIVETMKPLYDRDIKPIFAQKCFDCHAAKGRTMPFYASWPIASHFINKDIHQATEHLDMSEFPFAGHGSLAKDMKAIIEVVNEGDMPPLLYRLLHSDAKLTEAEAKAIKSWAENGLTQN